MKKFYSFTLVLSLLFCLFCTTKIYAQQNDCGNNAGFETGNPAGWVCKFGYYGPTPCPLTGTCPEFNTTYTGTGPLNTNGICAVVTGANDRHTIMQASCGNDPNTGTGPAVPVVPPGGGNYSFRLGNANVGTLNNGSLAEAVRLSFPVTSQNAGFTYRYAAFLQDPGHTPESQPRFEIVVMDKNDSVIPCGFYKVVAGSSTSCPGTGSFNLGSGTGTTQWHYKGWTDVGLDLTGYIGQTVSIEFRTSDCIPINTGSSSLNCSNGICTTCLNGGCCTYPTGGTPCVPPAGCSYSPGSHSAYVYIDAYCSPLSIESKKVCAGTSSLQVCAPTGYASYSWPALGLTGQCVTINNPVPGTVYTVNMLSVTGCPTQTTVSILGLSATTRDTTICSQGTGTVPLNVTPTGGVTYTYNWTGPNGFTSTLQNPVVPLPLVTSIYTVTVTDQDTCSITKYETVNIAQPSLITINGVTSICYGGKTTLTAVATNGMIYSWTPRNTLSNPDSSVTDANPTQNTTYTVTVTNSLGCVSTKTVDITVNPISVSASPPTQICFGNSTTISASGGVTYSWTPSGTLDNATLQSPVASPIITTIYTVTVTTSAGCIGTATTTVTVNKLPIVNFVASTMCIDAAPFILTGGSPAGGIYSGPGVTGTTFNPAAAGVGPHTLTYSFTDANSCNASAMATFTVNPLPIVTFAASTVCETDAPFTMTGGSPAGGTYSGDGVTGSTFDPAAAGVGTHTLTYNYTDANGCGSSATATFTVNPAGTVTISSIPTMCVTASPVTLSGSPAGGTFSGVGVVGNTFDPSIAGAGPFLITYTFTATSCLLNTTASTTVIVNPQPVAIINVTPPTGCNHGSYINHAILTASGTAGVTYQWYFNGHAIAGATNQTYTATQGGWYNLVVALNGCVSDSAAGQKITLFNVTCGHDTTKKTVICHVPDCRYNKEVTICIGNAAVPAHLRNHACDCIGPCPNPHPNKRDMEEVDMSGIEFSVYPNPFRREAVIEFYISDAARTTLEIFDIKGTLINKPFDVDAENDKFYTTNLSGMAEGVYIARLQSGDFTKYLKLIVTN